MQSKNGVAGIKLQQNKAGCRAHAILTPGGTAVLARRGRAGAGKD